MRLRSASGCKLAQIDAADAHRAGVGIVEAQQQLDERALAGAVLADQRDQLAAANVQARDPATAGSVPPGYVNVTSSNSMPVGPRRRHGRGAGSAPAPAARSPGTRSSRRGTWCADRPRRTCSRCCRACRRPTVNAPMTSTTPPGSIVPATPLHRDEHVGERERRAGDEPGQHRDARARAIHLLALPEQLLGEIAVPAEQVIGQHVGADLLGVPRLHQQIAEVLALALLGRLLVEELVQPRGHAPLEHQRQHAAASASTTST